MRMNSCGTCRFARNWRSGTMIDESGVVSSNPRVECHRYPVTCDKREDDTSGRMIGVGSGSPVPYLQLPDTE